MFAAAVTDAAATKKVRAHAGASGGRKTFTMAVPATCSLRPRMMMAAAMTTFRRLLRRIWKHSTDADMVLILTADDALCPQCNALLNRVDRVQRICTSCGLVARYVSMDDERDKKDAALPRAKAFKEEHGITDIGMFRVRW
jgi:hypothetical protein